MAELGTAAAVAVADATIEIDGEDQPLLAAGLLSLLTEETTEGLFRCEARFGNWGTDRNGGYLYFDRDVLDFGRTIAVRAGDGEGEGEIFRGRITGLEAQYATSEAPSLVVMAEDRGQDLRMVRRTRVFESMSDADVFGAIATDHGLQAEIDVQGPTHKVLAQLNQSDLAFIRERARWLDADVWLVDRTLHVQAQARRARGGEDLSLQFGRGLLECTVTADLAQQHTSVVVSGWDVQAKDRISYEAEESALGSELAGDTSGASILEQALGKRVDRLVHEVPLTAAETQALAQATFRAQARRFVVGNGVARGDARLRVGVRVGLSGLGPMFDGAYYMSEVRHLYARQDGGGYTTEFMAERPGVAAARA